MPSQLCSRSPLRPQNGGTALLHAVFRNRESTVLVLIEAGANVCTENKVAPESSPECAVLCVWLMLAATMTSLKQDGWTPLHYSQSKAVVEALVRAGANVAAANKVGPAISVLLAASLHVTVWWLNFRRGGGPLFTMSVLRLESRKEQSLRLRRRVSMCEHVTR